MTANPDIEKASDRYYASEITDETANRNGRIRSLFVFRACSLGVDVGPVGVGVYEGMCGAAVACRPGGSN